MTNKSVSLTNRKLASEDFNRTVILRMLMKILAELENYDRELDLILLCNRLKSILNIIEHSASKSNSYHETNNEDHVKFELFKNLLEREFHSKHKVSCYSRKIGMSPAKLSSICLSYTGLNAKEMINARIISESKKMLLSSTLSIKEISGILGFSDQYQFSKYFKKYMATAPLFYRKSFFYKT